MSQFARHTWPTIACTLLNGSRHDLVVPIIWNANDGDVHRAANTTRADHARPRRASDDGRELDTAKELRWRRLPAS